MEQEKAKIATIGMFDGVHLGHRWLIDTLLAQSEKRGQSPVVFTFDRHPLSLIAPEKAPKSLMPVNLRIEKIMSAGVDEVILLEFDENLRSLTAERFMAKIRDEYGVKTILMGYNHSFGSDCIRDYEEFLRIGQREGVEIIKGEELTESDNKKGVSSSAIRLSLTAGDVEEAAMMLGRQYELAGEVVHGKQLGRSIGFPTANIIPSDAGQLIPGGGVYAVDVSLGYGEVRRAMLNIGVRPTVDRISDAPVSLEAHLIDWKGDLYGHEITVSFIKRLRDERRFETIDGLKAQLSIDLEAARSC